MGYNTLFLKLEKTAAQLSEFWWGPAQPEPIHPLNKAEIAVVGLGGGTSGQDEAEIPNRMPKLTSGL